MSTESLPPPAENYTDNKITTQTIILSTNLNIICEQLYDRIHIPHLDVDTSKKEPLKRYLMEEPSLKTGDIVYKKCKNVSEGYAFKKKPSADEGAGCKYFRNSITVIIKVQDKFLNIKISNKGKIQITGCSKNEYIPALVIALWKLLCDHPDTFTYRADTGVLRVVVIHVMVNINFSLGFQINQTLMNQAVLKHTNCISIYEKTSGYVGVNIKINVHDDTVETILVDEYLLVPGGDRIESIRKVPYMDYIRTLEPKEQKKKIPKCYTSTFLVFYSGKVIMSGGVSIHNRVEAYNQFVKIVKDHRAEFETVYE